MSPLTLGIFILAITTSVMSARRSNDLLQVPHHKNSELKTRGLLPSISIIDAVRKLTSCVMKCIGKYCQCCQTIQLLLLKTEVCGITHLIPAEGSLEVGLKVSGLMVLGSKVKIGKISGCNSLQTKLGSIEICINSSLTEPKNNAQSFKICSNALISLLGQPTLQVTLSCLSFSNNVSIEGSTDHGMLTMGSVKLLNANFLAAALRKVLNN